MSGALARRAAAVVLAAFAAAACAPSSPAPVVVQNEVAGSPTPRAVATNSPTPPTSTSPASGPPQSTPPASPPVTSPPQEPPPASAAERYWERHEPMAYRYTLTVDCFCPGGRFDVVVRNGEVVHSRGSGSGGFGKPPGGLTIDGLFTVVRQADGGGSSPPAGSVSVSYDKRYGYPQRIGIDWITDAIDDEIIYTVSDFQVLEPDPR